MKIIKFIIKIYQIITRIGSYIDFKKIADDFKGKNNVEKRDSIRRPRDRRNNKSRTP
jgi:hypothetical protein